MIVGCAGEQPELIGLDMRRERMSSVVLSAVKCGINELSAQRSFFLE
jgi:hypothetical protein